MSIIRKVAVVVVAIGALLAAGLPALAQVAQVTRGDFASFAAGPSLGYNVSGRAQMVRTADGQSIVTVHVTGLQYGVAYGAHVHNLPCSVNDGGGHYQDMIGGPADPVNEIWPGFTANQAGIGNGFAANDFTARPEAQSVVIHDPNAANARIACADLN
jgi:Cu-Zn family superoxide dismutase